MNIICTSRVSIFIRTAPTGYSEFSHVKLLFPITADKYFRAAFSSVNSLAVAIAAFEIFNNCSLLIELIFVSICASSSVFPASHKSRFPRL